MARDRPHPPTQQGPRAAVEGRESDNLLLRMPFLALRTVLDLLPLVAFAAAAYGVLPLTEPGLVARLVILAIVNANLLARAVLVVARLVLTPAPASLRVLPIRDVTANYLFIWTRRLSTVAIYGYFAAEAALLPGLPVGGYRAFLNLVGLLVTGILAVFLVQKGRGRRGPSGCCAGSRRRKKLPLRRAPGATGPRTSPKTASKNGP